MGLMNFAVIQQYLFRFLVMIIAIPVHESAHAWVSAKLGDSSAKDAGRVSLNIMHHLDPMGAICMIFTGIGWAKPVSTYPARFKNPKVGMAITAAAGPLSNILLAFVSMLLYKIVYYTTAEAAVWDLILIFLYYMVYMNINLAVFNLIPVPPFDGSRIATLFLPQKLYFKIMEYERYIFIGVFLLLMFGFLDLPLSVVGNFMWNLLDSATSFVDAIVRNLYTGGIAL